MQQILSKIGSVFRFYCEGLRDIFGAPLAAVDKFLHTITSGCVLASIFVIGISSWFLLLFSLSLFFVLKGDLVKHRWFLCIALWSIPLPYIASELGWGVAEIARQPWIIKDLMPGSVAVSNLPASSVKTSFFMVAIIFTALIFITWARVKFVLSIYDKSRQESKE